MLDLSSTFETAVLLDPAGHRSEQRIEHRRDPLTGSVASINLALGEKAKAFLGTADLALLDELQEKSRSHCPFCAAAEKGTRFPPGMEPHFPAGAQLRRGGTVACPNLFSKCALDAVVVIDHTRHELRASRFSVGALGDAVALSADLLRRARALDPTLVHHAVGMNFLQPAGSSVPHPHFQVHARSVPYTGVARALEASAAFRARTGRSFFEVLVEEEKALGLRHVGSTGPVEWLAAFAPAHQREVWGVLPGVASLAALTDAQAQAFAAGLAQVAAAYEEGGTHPFNLIFYSSPSPDDAAHFALHVRLCARPAFRSLYSNYDTWFTPKFLGDDVHTEPPEAIAGRLRARWSKEVAMEPKKTKVRDWMTPNPITIDASATVMEAIHLLKEKNIRRLPVMKDGNLAGVVTERMLLSFAPSKATTMDTWEMHYVLSKTKVTAAMNAKPNTVGPDTDLAECAKIIHDRRLNGIIVVDAAGKMVGILTTTNLLEALIHFAQRAGEAA